MESPSRYGPTLVRAVSDIIEARMRELGLRFQAQLAEALGGIDPGNLGKQIKGERTIPIERIGEWQRALRMNEKQAAEFDVAVRLTHSDEKIRELIARQDLELAEARAAMLLYEDRIAMLAEDVATLNAMRLRRIASQPKPPAPPSPPA